MLCVPANGNVGLSTSGNGSHDRRPMTVGMVGAGQLARMLCEAATPLGIETIVLAESENDAAVPPATRHLLGKPTELSIRELSDHAMAVTFDHEQVDLAALQQLEDEGRVLRPGPSSLAFTVDKSLMRTRLRQARLPVPSFAVLSGSDDPLVELMQKRVREFSVEHGWPLVLKAAQGGYDGKGVWIVHNLPESGEVLARAVRAGTVMLVEEHVNIVKELGALIVQRPGGEQAVWPVAETVQVDGICREMVVPGDIPRSVGEEARRLASRLARLTGVVGVLAVEMFWTGDHLLINEMAMRPHNSGHWTIEGARTSQFQNHLRAVLDLPLGDTSLACGHVSTVNVLGGPKADDPRRRLEAALAVPDACVHLYGKEPRPGRKLGHVTVCGDNATGVRRLAWRAAAALGTPVEEADPGAEPIAHESVREPLNRGVS